MEAIEIYDAHEHNLKHIDVRIPHGKLTVITGVSGSGKSTLAYDILYAEGHRRYVESLSSYARQFLGRLEKPKVGRILHLAPAVAIKQKTVSANARSTVGTATEIYDYLKLLFARVGETISPISGRPVRKDTVEDVVQFLKSRPTGSRWILSVRVPFGDRSPKEVLQILKNQDYSRILANGRLLRIDSLLEGDGQAVPSDFELVVDRIVVEDDPSYFKRIIESLETAFFQGHGRLALTDWETGERHEFSNRFELDGMEFPEPTVHLFSFNSPYGACPVCEGYGSVIDIDPRKVIPDPNKSVYEGAVAPWTGKKAGTWRDDLVRHAHKFDFPVHTPWKDLTEEQKELVWEGNAYFGGIRAFFRKLERKSYKIQNRVMLARYRGKTVCPACKGKRLRPEAYYVKVGGKDIGELVDMQVKDLIPFFDALRFDGQKEKIARRLLKEIRERLRFLADVGLDYLTLNRPMNTLSGGEAQRVRLALSLGSGLTGSVYVLDEPSVGLHPADTRKLISVLHRLRDAGNTVVVVEHDEEIIRAADHIIDLGPRAGIFGGEVVASGVYDDLIQSDSLTARYLRGEEKLEVPSRRRTHPDRLVLKGARLHNLKNIDVEFPLHTLTVVTGVSGSGKSSLVADTLYPALHRLLFGTGPEPGPYDELSGAWKTLENVELIGQEPVGRSSRSNPVTYLKIYDDIRRLMAAQPAARVFGFEPRHFSFNVPGGRCEACKGEGEITEKMQFMADVRITCDVCGGKRFKDEVLEVTFQGKNIHDILEMSVDEAVDFFDRHGQKDIAAKLEVLRDTGLGYVKLGQPVSTLSGGEAQRLKIASYLVKGAQAGPTLFIFDEPSTGLHFDDIAKLLRAFDRLIEKGHSILVIEHHPDIVAAADYVIDLGPGGGDQGGRLIFSGTPEEMIRHGRSAFVPFLASKLGERAEQ
ncbi:MAG: excinuclease ABC subunit UvrA [Chlorobi bacterium]|nr:excinuclease ABC subunit UvrA [Chlorobiota bacterium]